MIDSMSIHSPNTKIDNKEMSQDGDAYVDSNRVTQHDHQCGHNLSDDYEYERGEDEEIKDEDDEKGGNDC